MSAASRPAMPAQDRLVFACLKQDFGDRDAVAVAANLDPQAIDWAAFSAVALEHGIGPLMYASLKRCSEHGFAVPAEVLKRLRLTLFCALSEQLRRQGQIEQALAHCARLGREVMLLKGAALQATVYTQPALVLPLDIDLLVRGEASELNPEQEQSMWDINRSGPFELSFDVHHDLDVNGLLPVDYAAIWAEARVIELHGHRVFVMSPADMLVFACVNSCRKRYLHPRSLYAIRTLLESRSELDWDAVCSRACLHGCGIVVYTALATSSHFLGHPLPRDLWRKLGVGAPRRALLHWLIERMSYASLEDRTRMLRNGSVEPGFLVPRKWQFSLLLPYASYSWRQIAKRALWFTSKRTGDKG